MGLKFHAYVSLIPFPIFHSFFSNRHLAGCLSRRKFRAYLAFLNCYLIVFHIDSSETHRVEDLLITVNEQVVGNKRNEVTMEKRQIESVLVMLGKRIMELKN